MDYVSGIFFAFAGLACGYLIWNRDRRTEATELREVELDNERLRTALDIADSANQRQTDKFQRQQARLDVLQQLFDDWSENREAGEQRIRALEAELSESHQTRESLESALQLERQSRVKLEDQHLEDLHQWKRQLAESEQQGARLSTTLSQLQASNDAESTLLREQLEQSRVQFEEAHRRQTELESELLHQQQIWEAARQQASGLDQEYASVEEALSGQAELVKQLRETAAEWERRSLASEEQLGATEAGWGQTKTQLEEATQEIAVLEADRLEAANLQANNENMAAQLERVTEQLEQAQQSAEQHLDERTGLQTRLDNQEATIHRLRQQQDDALEKLKYEWERHRQVEADSEQEIDQLQESVDQLTGRCEQASVSILQLTEQRDQFAEQAHEVTQEAERRMLEQVAAIQQLTDQRDQLAEELGDSHAETAELLQSTSLKLEQLTLQRDQFAEQAKRSEQELLQLSEHLQQQMGQLVEESENAQQEAEQQLQQATRLAGQCDDLTTLCEHLESSVTERDESLQRLEAERLELMQQLNKQTGRLESEKSDLHQKMDQLAEQRDELLAEITEGRDAWSSSQQELDTARELIADLQRELEDQQILGQRIEELEQLVQERSQHDQSTQRELKSLEQDKQVALTSIEELQQRLQQTLTNEQQLQQEVATQSRGMRELEEQCQAAEDALKALRQERTAALARLAEQRAAQTSEPVISFTEAMALRRQNETSVDTEYGGHYRVHATRGPIFTEAPRRCDDLTQIEGVGLVLAARLNDYGIYTFKQIKDWSPEAVQEFSHLFSFEGQIQDQQWLAQAARLYAHSNPSQNSAA